MSKTDWTAEEVREKAHAYSLRGDSRTAAMLDTLAERIAADERVVPVATLHADGFWTWKGTPPPESNYAGWRMDVFTHPPAQPTKLEDAYNCASREWTEGVW